jgi:glycerate-2-kinase
MGRQVSLEAAAEIANRAGYRTLILGDAIEGEASKVRKTMGGICASSRSARPAPSVSMRPHL